MHGGELRPAPREQERAGPARWLACAAFLFVLALRVGALYGDANFDREHSEGLLRSDPGLLVYVTERIVESKGLPPEDFRADPRVAWPATADLPAMETVGQEFLAAWTWLAFGRASGLPLHLFVALLMSLVASLATWGVYLLAREIGARPLLAALACWLYAGTVYGYRTVGAILIREDLALPLFVLHLALAARALRLRTARSGLLAGLAGTAALASWHAMSFVVLMEVLALWVWFARTAESPFAGRAGLLACVPFVVGGLAIPVLVAKGFLLSPAFLLALALVVLELADARRRWPRARRVALALGLALLLLGGARLAGGQADYAHVGSLILAKLRTLGRLPDDPSGLDFGARLLWQGPFATASAWDLVRGLGLCGPVLVGAAVLALAGLLRARGERAFVVLAVLGAASLLSGWLIARTLVLAGLLAPPLAAGLAARVPRRALGAWALALGAALQLGLLADTIARVPKQRYIAWYAEPGEVTAELGALVRWAERSLPRDAGVMSDYVTSTALLAHTRNPIALQPKYETADTRRRIEEFATAYLRGGPQDVLRLCRRYRCRYLVVDRIGNWLLLGYLAGYPLSRIGLDRPPPEGTAAAVFGSGDPRVFGAVPGFRLLYRAPDSFYWDYYRVYEVLDERSR